jgi:hypothetical protein
MNAGEKRVPRVIVRRSPSLGRGLFARRDLRAGEVLLEYRGECVDPEKALLVPTACALRYGRAFLLGTPDGRIVNGECMGNPARWINHSCEPNCVAEERAGRIFIRTLRPIRVDRELTIDYALSIEDNVTPAMRERFVCRCGAQRCRGTMLKAPSGEPPVRPPRAQQFSPPQIRLLERLPRNRIVVSWRQPGRACYSEQIWSPSTASVAGTCALSMVSFEVGAQVFLPMPGEYPPHNRDERILAEAILLEDLESVEA